MKLWAVYGGFGLFVVRAATIDDAKRVAVGTPEQCRAPEALEHLGYFGHTVDDITDVVPLPIDGAEQLLAVHYG